jgi:hypothetical protein
MQLSGRAFLFDRLGPNPSAEARIYLNRHPLGEAFARLAESAGHYTLTVALARSKLLPDSNIRLALSFDRYFVPEKLGYGSDSRHLVIPMPKEIRLLTHGSAEIDPKS